VRIAVIPARGGSKRIPRKNIKPFCGQPMIAWTIQAAQESGCFDRIIVSTDDEEIAAVSQSFGAEIPFIRPANLSNDYTGTVPVMSHAVQWHLDNGVEPSEVCCVYATAPFVQGVDLERGLSVLQETESEYAFSVTSYSFPIQRAIRITQESRIEMFYPEHLNTRSQDLEEAWHDAGQFYWGRSQAWLSGKPLFSRDSSPVILPRYRVQDIDTEEDWEHAEWLFKAMHR
jgi:N-acylneuraminate cytidylyltransferase